MNIKEWETSKKKNEWSHIASTSIDPIRTEQVSFLRGEGGSVLEHMGDKGQSPQEQPSEVSPHGYIDTFIRSIGDDPGTLDLKLMP